jgi:uncharacterized membrane protein YccC
LNSIYGCAVGLAFLAIGSSSEWKLPLAMATSTLVSTYVVRVPAMWRQCPITAALVVAASLTEHSSLAAAEIGLRRVGEILLGCLFGVVVSWLMSKVWHVPVRPKAAKA